LIVIIKWLKEWDIPVSVEQKQLEIEKKRPLAAELLFNQHVGLEADVF